MAPAVVGVIYGNVDRKIRRIIFSDNEAQLDGHIRPDETMVRVVASTYAIAKGKVAQSLGLMG